MSNADLIERLLCKNGYMATYSDCLAAADALEAADKRIAELECKEGGGCTLAGPGRGDCEHAVGLPGKSIPGQHDGQDDTVDAYGKPNGWCWSCWKSRRIAELEAGRDNFHMEYRMKCDEETKQLERKLVVAREALKSVVSWSQLRTIENINAETDIVGECVPIRLTGLKTCVAALAQIGGEDVPR